MPMFEYSKHDVIKLVNILFPHREVSCDKLEKHTDIHFSREVMREITNYTWKH